MNCSTSKCIALFLLFLRDNHSFIQKPPQMANQIAASIYAINKNALGPAHGVSFSFAPGTFLARHVDPAESYSNVACNAIIQVLPTGLNQPYTQYYTNLTVAQIVTASNA
jgi:hypothetical protein